MVLTPKLAEEYLKRRENYNQTSSKSEQLALAQYISCGRLDRQLRRLRKLYSEKSDLMYRAVRKEFPSESVVEVIETALCVRVKLRTKATMEQIIQISEKHGVRLGKCRVKNGLKYFYLSFAGIPNERIELAVQEFRNAVEEANAI